MKTILGTRTGVSLSVHLLTWIVVWPGKEGFPGPVAADRGPALFREALMREKCSAAERISLFAIATSSFRPVTTKMGCSPLTGVLM